MLLSLVLLPAFISSALALVSAVDSSTLVSEATYAKARGEGFTKAIIRGYEEACGVGGEVDPNFVSSYNNARAAGYTDIDMYWFPCNGADNACKSYSEQVQEISDTFNAHGMQIGTIWIDIEKDAAICNNVCGFLHNMNDALSRTVELWHSREPCSGERRCSRRSIIWLQFRNLQ